MCSHSSSRLENWLRVHLLSCLFLLDKATKGATTINVFFPIESTPASVLLCSFCVCALFCQTPSRSWQMATHNEPGLLIHCTKSLATIELYLPNLFNLTCIILLVLTKWE
ncbi:hypothetical protein GOODEAATRI_015326 [Goodea atripinnis]|uniref:Secreted protein n=1 Tax=Goodea atripinnis TaxID=208336 RepID=A0ABV0MI02_9TELE